MSNKKTVWITGASGGIGSAIAAAFAKEGNDLLLTGFKNAKALHEMAGHLSTEESIEVMVLTGDISKSSFVDSVMRMLDERQKNIDILVNCAGISHIGLLSDMKEEKWDEVLDVNLKSAFLTSRAVIPHMVHEKSGRIINISSVWGHLGASCEVAYSASKGGMDMFTKSLAKELAPSGICVNAISCGCIDTKMNACFSKEEREALCEEIPAGRFGRPEEVADLALYLAKAPSYLTGQIIGLDGGWGV